MSFSMFEHSPKGERIRPLIADAIQAMEAASDRGQPALIAVADKIEQAAPDLSNTEKQHVGRWIHRLLGPRGWRPVDTKRMPSGSMFRTAAVYRRIDAASPEPILPAAPAGGDTASRLRAARAGIARLPHKPGTVAQFIAAKRRAANEDA